MTCEKELIYARSTKHFIYCLLYNFQICVTVPWFLICHHHPSEAPHTFQAAMGPALQNWTEEKVSAIMVHELLLPAAFSLCSYFHIQGAKLKYYYLKAYHIAVLKPYKCGSANKSIWFHWILKIWRILQHISSKPTTSN